jgi:hypothetical protein
LLVGHLSHAIDQTDPAHQHLRFRGRFTNDLTVRGTVSCQGLNETIGTDAPRVALRSAFVDLAKRQSNSLRIVPRFSLEGSQIAFLLFGQRCANPRDDDVRIAVRWTMNYLGSKVLKDVLSCRILPSLVVRDNSNTGTTVYDSSNCKGVSLPID